MMLRSSTKYAVRLMMALMLCAAYDGVSAEPARAADAGQGADELFQKGRKLYQAGKIREARETLAAAWVLKKSYDIAANLATAELELGMARDAAEHFAYCIRTFPSTGSKKQLGVVQKSLDDARAKVGALQVKVNVDGAEVLIDGKSIGRAPLKDDVYVEPGARVLEAKLAGYESATQSVQVVKGGAVQPITLTLVEAKAAALPPVGGPVVSGKPDDKGAAKADAGNGDAPPPRPPPPLKEEPKGGPNKAIVIAGGATAGAALIAGVVFTVVANGKAADARAKQDMLVNGGGQNACLSPQFTADCIALRRLHVDVSSFTNAAGWSFVGAGAVAAGTLIYALATRPKAPASAPALRATPMVTGQGGGLWLAGRW